MPDLPQILTIHETSEYLRIPLSSMYKLAQEGKIPCQKIGRHWRFFRPALEKWLQANQGQEYYQETAIPNRNE